MTLRRLATPFLPIAAGVGARPATGLGYLLRDMFITDRVAGQVNGTPAEPGPGNRFVGDTASVLSVVGGKLNIATGGPGTNDPRLALNNGIARQGGRLLALDFLGTANLAQDIGWGASTNNFQQSAFRLAGGGVLQVLVNAAIITVGSWSVSTPYQLISVLRQSAGSFLLIKGGAFSQWRPVWIDSLDSTATLFAGCMAVNTNAIFECDNFRVPVALYIPTPLASDSFNRANGPLGVTDGAGHPEANGGAGLSWEDRVGTWASSGSNATATALSGGLAIATVPTSTPDAIIDVEITRSAGNVGGVARYQDASNYLRFSHDGTNMLCEQVVGGTPTTLRTGAATYSAGAVGRLIVSGTQGRLFYNNAAIGAVFTVPNSTYGNHGLYTTNIGNSLDDFQVWARGTEGQYSILDNF